MTKTDPYARRPDIHWALDAACTPNAAWTTETRPNNDLLRALRTVCHRCPVIADCAQYALGEDVTSGVYAGVWLPSKHHNGRRHARHELARKTHRGGAA